MENGSILSRFLAKIPIELHIPGYQFCGPNSQVAKRLALGRRGMNPLDSACLRHDLAYDKYKDLKNGHKADKLLVEFAKKRLVSRESTFNEKLAYAIAASTIGLKRKVGVSTEKNIDPGGKRIDLYF